MTAGKQSSGDGAGRPAQPTISEHANHLCDEIIRQEFVAEFARKTLGTKQEVEITSRDMVQQVINVSHNVLLPMLQEYERRTGVRVTSEKVNDSFSKLSDVE